MQSEPVMTAMIRTLLADADSRALIVSILDADHDYHHHQCPTCVKARMRNEDKAIDQDPLPFMAGLLTHLIRAEA